jgi:hypothetical protein
MMTDKFQLNARAKRWIKSIQGQYASTMVEDKRIIAQQQEIQLQLSTNLMK